MADLRQQEWLVLVRPNYTVNNGGTPVKVPYSGVEYSNVKINAAGTDMLSNYQILSGGEGWMVVGVPLTSFEEAKEVYKQNVLELGLVNVKLVSTVPTDIVIEPTK